MRRLVFGLVIAAVVLAFQPPSTVRPVSVYAAPDPRPAAAFSAPANYIVTGVHLDPVSTYQSEIANFGSATGKNVGIVMYFRPWDLENISGGRGPCDDGFLPRMAFDGGGPVPGTAGGRVVMLTWEPLALVPNKPPPYDYDNILNHSFDTLIDNCALQLKAWSNETFLIRFMHEMNIPDSPWWAGHSYNQKPDGTGDTDKFKQAWRYVWQRFANKGVTNVQWVWSPNYGSTPNVAWNSLHNYYPGDAYVDWIGLDGYNWATNGLQSYSNLYDAVITDIQCRYAKPIMHAEIGSAPYDNGGFSPPNKEAWITDAYTRMQSYPLVRAVVWFNDFAYHQTNHPDFRVWTSSSEGFNPPPSPVPASVTNAYKSASAVGDSAFTSTYTKSQLLNPPMTRCSGDVVSSNGVLSGRPFARTVARTGQTSASFDIGALGLGAASTLTISGCPGSVICRFGSPSGPTSLSFSAPWDTHKLVVRANSDSPLGPLTITITGAGGSVQVQVNIVQKIWPTYLPTVSH